MTAVAETNDPAAGAPADKNMADDSMARSARLRHLIITVYGLYARHDGGWLSVATLIRLLADLGIDEPAVRSAISRLKRRGILQSRRDKFRNVAGKDRLETVIGDLPAHHVETAGPGVFACGDQGRALRFGRQQRSRGAIAEQSRRDNVAFRQIVASE